MNFIKRASMVGLTLTLFWINIECMDEKYDDNVTVQDQNRKKTGYDKMDAVFDFMMLGDYLTQFASIYAIDSVNTKTISNLAKLRTFYNGLCSIGCGLHGLIQGLKLHDNGIKTKPLINIGHGGLYMLINGSDIFKDIKILRNTDLIASNNKIRNDANLRNKKLSQCLWLSLNAVIENILDRIKLERIGVKGAIRCGANLLISISELYRRNLLYKLIVNKQKLK